MAKLTVGQAQNVGTLIHYLLGTTASDDSPTRTAEQATEALAELAEDGFARMMAGPGADRARAAIAAVEQLRAQPTASRVELEEVFGFWMYRRPWTPTAPEKMSPITAADAASIKGSRDRVYHAFRTPWQPFDGQAVASDGR